MQAVPRRRQSYTFQGIPGQLLGQLGRSALDGVIVIHRRVYWDKSHDSPCGESPMDVTACIVSRETFGAAKKFSDPGMFSVPASACRCDQNKNVTLYD